MFDHIGQIPAAAALRYADKQALYFEGKSFTFIELNALIEAVAGGLSHLGVLSRDRVTLYAANSWEWIVSYYGIARVGAVINPANTMLTPGEIEYVVKDCRAKAIIASLEKVEAILGVKERSHVGAIISFGEDVPDGAISFNQLIADGRAAPPLTDIDPTALASIAYTSGTTGQPKGAMQSHRAVIINSAMTSQMHQRGVDDSRSS